MKYFIAVSAWLLKGWGYSFLFSLMIAGLVVAVVSWGLLGLILALFVYGILFALFGPKASYYRLPPVE